MNRIKNWLREADWLALIFAFAIPAAILLLIHIALDVYPFGSNSVLVLDLNGQYVYFYEGLKDIIQNGGSILYSWSRALGGEFLGIFAYYLASPFSLLVALFSDRHITEALLFIELLKCGACGLTMVYYLQKSHPSKRTNKLIFSTLYAVCAYAIVYGHNIMWIDALIYLPLITLGIEKLISERRFKLFVITLYLCVSATFYIGYMVCIWVVLYFFYFYFSTGDKITNNFYGEKAHFVRSLIRIGVFSLIACALAAWILLPTYKSLTFGKTTFSDPDFSFNSKFTFFEFFGKFLFGSYDTVRPEGLPVVYCGMLTLILVPLYFLCKKISVREKIFGGLLAGILCISMASSTIDLIWHGMQRPNWLNYRYSFMLVFILLVFSYKAFCNIDSFDFRIVTAVCAFICVLIFIVQSLKYENTPDLTCIWISAGLVLIYLIALHPIKKGYLLSGGTLILCVIVCVECFCAGLFNLNSLDEDVTISSRTSYLSFFDKYTDIVERIKEKDTSFYRMEKYSHRKTNDNFTLGMYGLSNSTSTLNASAIEFLNRMGYSSKSHWSKYLGGTPVNDALLGLKYIIYDSERQSNLYDMTDYDSENKKYVFLNPYALPIAYGVSSEFDFIFDITEYKTPFEMMNAMLGAMLGKDNPVNVFKQIEVNKTNSENLISSVIQGHTKYMPDDENEDSMIRYFITAPNDGMLYAFFPSDYPREVDVFANGSSKGTFFGNETDRIIELGYYEKGQTVQVSLTLEEENLYLDRSSDFYFAYIDEDVYREVFQKLGKGGFEVTEYSDTRLYGTVTLEEGMTELFTTIPYDDGWKLTVDGEEVEIGKTVDALISAQLTPGTHTVELNYHPDCFYTGLYISLSALGLFVIICIIDMIIRKKRKNDYYNRHIISLR